MICHKRELENQDVPEKHEDHLSLDDFELSTPYRIRNRKGIERLVNLISISYSATIILSYSDELFSGYKSASAQETRYAIGHTIQASVILGSFASILETVKNVSDLKSNP